jgi:DNA (cytosine-5)-methyltransferase 1
VLADLEADGYAARTFIIPAAGIGARHRRDRLWIVATDTNRSELREQPGRRDGSHPTDSIQPRNDGTARPMADAARQADGSYPIRTSERQIQELGDRSRAADVAYANCAGLAVGKGKPSNARSELAPAVGASWWSLEPDVGRVANGIPRRVDRLRCLGNAVVPQVVEEIGRAIMLSV